MKPVIISSNINKPVNKVQIFLRVSKFFFFGNDLFLKLLHLKYYCLIIAYMFLFCFIARANNNVFNRDQYLKS